MKKISIFLIFALLVQAFAFAAPPTVTSSNLVFSDLDGAQFSGTYTVGNGANRIIVMKKGSPVTGLPVNGVDYVANSVFGSAGSAFTAAGEFVVAKTGWNSYSVSGLEAGTTYYVAIFEYNGSGAATQYLMVPLTGSQSTVIAPTVQAGNMNMTAKTGNTLTLSWTKGNGTGRIILARKGAPVNTTPSDLTNYFGDANFENGTKLNVDNYVVYKGAGTSTTLKNLEPNTTYYFAIFEYNGNTSPMHLKPAATYSATTNEGPTLAASSPGFNYIEGNSYTIAVTYGNGTRRIFIARKGAPVTSAPVNGMSYTADGAFGSGTELAPGEFVVGNTTGNSASVTNLEPNTVYHFRIFEYDVDKAGNTYYLTSSFPTKSGSTATTPATISSNLHLTSLTGNSANIAFTAGSGNYRMVLMKAGSAVDATPADLTRYQSNGNFGSGAQIGTGNYVVQWGMNGSSFIANNLQPGVTYHVALYEFNGYEHPVYSSTGATFSFTVPSEPTAASTSPFLSFIEGKSLRLGWTNGTGSKRIVIVKKGSAVTAKPIDQAVYTANVNFGQGQELAPGEFVVMNSSDYYFDLKNLEIASTYHFAIFEYNVGPDGKPDYLTSSWLSTTGSTVSAPTVQTTLNATTAITSSTATINFTKGNGENRLFVMKQGAAVNVFPQDLVRYNYATSFGSPVTLISDGNYVMQTTSGIAAFGVSNLQPNTTYYVSAFEYNGFGEPAYLRNSVPVISFTTTDVPGATIPTTPASAPVVTNVDGNKLTFKFTGGNGEKRIVIMRQGSAVSFVPASATNYTANASFGAGTDLGGGQFVVMNNSSNTVDITNLLPSTTYYFAVYEYNGTGTLIRYLNTALTANGGTSAAPTGVPANVATSTASGQLTLNWTNGNGSGRLVVLKENAAVTAVPSDLGVYPASSVFKSGSQIAVGEYVVYAGAGSSVTITGLTNNKTYFYKIFEYNGSAAPVYNTAAAVAGSAVISSALPVKLVYFTASKEGNQVLLKWATSEEINSSSFVIERSTDAVHFDAIKSMAAAGNSTTTQNYSFADKNLPSGKIYYRLKQVDVDGKSVYSAVQAIENKGLSVRVYPNPVINSLRIDLPQGAAIGLVSVYDAKGVLVAKQSLRPGQSIDTGSWGKGVYMVTVLAGGEEFKSTVVK